MNYRNYSRFTLIELLVTIAVIAILLAILLPILSKAKETSKKLTCVSNQKQIALLLSLYQGDYNFASPGACSTFRGDQHTTWAQFIDGPENLVYDMYYGGKAPYARGTIFRCSKNKQDNHRRNVYGVYWTARYLSEDKSFMETLKVDEDGDGDVDIYDTSMDYFLINLIPQPQNFMMLGCTLATSRICDFQWHGTAKIHWGMLKSDGASNTVHGLWLPHLNRCNGLFVDGHVESLGNGTLQYTRNAALVNNLADRGIWAWKLENGTHIDLK